jgi:Ni/Co efflux regulator RcnB
MRKILCAVLAASVLFPTIATAQASGDARESAESWKTYRETNSEVFRLPAYVPPPGLFYRRIGIGQYLAQPFYGRSYWIENHADYRLPPPDSNHRYIRYGNDVLLMRKGSGRVARVFRNFFL